MFYQYKNVKFFKVIILKLNVLSTSKHPPPHPRIAPLDAMSESKINVYGTSLHVFSRSIMSRMSVVFPLFGGYRAQSSREKKGKPCTVVGSLGVVTGRECEKSYIGRGPVATMQIHKDLRREGERGTRNRGRRRRTTSPSRSCLRWVGNQ